MLTRRELLGSTLTAGAAALLPSGCVWPRAASDRTVVNDLHSKLNPSHVVAISRPASVEAVQREMAGAIGQGRALCIAGGRHAMGGQQFGEGTVLLDMTGMNRVLRFDADAGLIEVEAGIEWPELIGYLVTAQRGRAPAWGIVQKQTGADRLTIGGALAANAHGRGLTYRPIVQDIEAITLVDARGRVLTASRRENAELFRLVVGGYGLFGVVTSVTLRLGRRRKLERVVEVMDVERFLPMVERRIADGYLYGDFQYATDPRSDDLLRRGVFSCYRPVEDARPMPAGQKELAVADWERLLYLSHADKRQAFETYAAYYRSTSGQLYWSDTSQLSVYIDNYHVALDRQLGAAAPATEMITEIYVPRERLGAFLDDVRRDMRDNAVALIYGTIRLIERDDESVLTWARQPWACVIFNLHVVHTEAGLERAAADFRRLIDHGLRHGGSYFLTYHRWATREQVLAAHPRFPEFLREKRRLDPAGLFQSDWYRHHAALLDGA